MSQATGPDGHDDINIIFDDAGEPPRQNFSVINLVGVEKEANQPGYHSANFSPVREPSSSRLMQIDYSFHNSDTFPHMHHPLQPQFHRHKNKRKEHGRHRKKSDSIRFEVGDPELEDGWTTNDVAPKPRPVRVMSFSDTDTEDHLLDLPARRARTVTENSVFSTDDEHHEVSPLISPEIPRIRSIIRHSETDTCASDDEAGKKRAKVKFNIGDRGIPARSTWSPRGSDFAESDPEKPSKFHRRRRHHHHHHHRRKTELVEDPEWRRHPGSEMTVNNFAVVKPTTDDEAEQLKEQDLNEMSTHRYADARHRRHRVNAKTSIATFFHLSDQAARPSGRYLPMMKKAFDHSPHEIFVELSELQYVDAAAPPEWKETARWIKYEEDVEGADNRWGKPHIAFLDFNALFSLRKGLDRGAVLLDLDEKDLPSIATRVVDHMVTCDQIPFEQRDAVIRILLLRHKHIKEQPNLLRRASRGSRMHMLGASLDKLPDGAPNMGRRGSRRLSNIFHVNTFSNFGRRSSSEDPQENGGKDRSRNNSFTQINMEEGVEMNREKFKQQKDIMKKIPDGAEATAVLVGAVDFLKTPTIAFVRLAEGVVMENLIEVPIPVRFMFVLLGPFQGEMDYHEVGRSISTLMSDKAFHEVAYKAHTRGQLLSAINDFLNASIVLPPSEWNDRDLIPFDQMRAKSQEILRKSENLRAQKEREAGTATSAKASVEAITAGDEGDGKKPPPRDPLKRSGKLFHGLVQDIKIRYPQYMSDIRDGFSSQVLSAIVFIFFASLSPSITFGGIYSDNTERLIGVGETLLVTSINGMIFSLFSAQPLLIVGASGPLMIFDMSLLNFCKSQGLDYLSLRVWVGLWTLAIGIIVTAFELVSVVKKFTRFTEEIFSSLVCLIFIYGAFDKLFVIFDHHPLMSHSTSECFTTLNGSEILDGVLVNGSLINATDIDGEEVDEMDVIVNQPNTALLSMCLMLGTFIVAFKLKKFRNSKFLGRSVRRALGDFGVPISIIVMVGIDFFIKDTYTDKLSMPSGLQPSNSEVRGWLINPFGVITPLPLWAMIAAGPAALLLFILIFLEENICHLILKKPERCLKKGTGFHLDLLIACITSLISGVLGAPFMGPACVRTISHMSALTVMSSNVAPGESPKIVGCLEQRVSSFFVSLFVGLAVFLYFILNLVPTSVLLGIFLYMGVSATAGIQLIERSILFFMPVKHHPNVAYVKKVRTWKMNCFTAVQILMLVILWVVMQSPASLCVPFVLMLLIPVRLFLIPKFFDATEIAALDGTEQSSMMESPNDEPDFYEVMHDLPPMETDNHNHQS